MTDVLQLTSLCSRAVVPVLNQPQLVYVLTELYPAASASYGRLPLNFALVLDRSGSMAGTKLRTMKEAVKNIIDQLDPADIVSIVTFETRTQVLVQAQPATDKEELKRQVDKIKDGGGTNMATGLREALGLVRQMHGPNRTSRIVLLTDGEATDDENDSRGICDESGAMGIPVIGMGFGKDWNEDFIVDLSDRSHGATPGSMAGRVQYIQAPDQAIQAFNEVFRSMQVVAQDAQITIRMVQGLEARRVWQVVPMIKDIGLGTIQGRAVVIPVGELEKGGAAFLVEMMLPPRPAGAVRIAQTDVTFNVPGLGAQRQAVDLIVQFSPEAGQGQVNGHVMNIVEKVQAFKLQTQALDEAEMGNVSGATRKLRQAVTILLSQGETDLADQMAQEAERLEQSGEMSNEGKKTIKLTSRKTVKLSE
ncbi:MAG: VWA domain-containing protein [Chloroflexota bacterium]